MGAISEEKALLREYHRNETALGGILWGVSDRTLREWASVANRKRVPARVIEYIEGERANDARSLTTPPHGGEERAR